MKRLATLLRRLAAHLDPLSVRQGPVQELRIKVTAETGAAREALARLAAEMEGLRVVSASATTRSLLCAAIGSLRREPWTWTPADHGLYAAALAALRCVYELDCVECQPQDNGHHRWTLDGLTVVSHPELPALVALASKRGNAPEWLGALAAELFAAGMVSE